MSTTKITPLVLLNLLLWCSLTLSPITADNRVNIVKGVVGAVSVVTNEQGQPILGKYSAEGDYLDDIDSEYSQTGYSVLSAQSYKIAYQLAQDLKAANSGSTLISRSSYDGRGYTTQGKNPISMIKPRLKNDSGTLSLLIVNEQQLYNSEPAYEQFILQEFSIDLSDGNAQQLDPKSVSIIVNKAGQVQYQSPYTLGYKIAPFKTNEDGTYQTEKDYRIATHPLGRVTLVAGNYYGGSASNLETGRYVLPYAIPPCPGFFYQLKVPIVAKVPIHNFNPKKSNSATTIPAIAYDYATCIGYGDFPLGATLQAVAAQLKAKQIATQITKPTSNLNFTFATMQLAAIARFKDVTLSDITQYHNENLTIKYSQDINFDFDGDDQDDLIVEHKNADGSIDETKIDIYLGDREEYTNGIRNKPDLTRLADYEQIKQHKNQALLKTISEDDLNNTDIYYYRSSTGQLIGSTEGLGNKDNNNQNAIITGGANSYVYQQIEKDQNTATFSFANLLIGAESNDLISGYVTDPNKTRRLPWIGSNAAASEVKAEDPINYLRPGESVDIIAINRATGYIGNIQVKLPLGNNEIIQHKITMMPPNLKVIATRSYKTQAGLKKDTQNDNQLIGSEGAGLSSDQYIKIQTIWLDQQGKVLPEELSGYTGRIAIVRSGLTKDYSGTFDISPGYNTEFIKLNNADDLQNEHYYVQVSGESFFDGNPSFDTGSATGKLATRPRTYVPLKVPVFDEAQTTEAKNQHLQATLAEQAGLAEKIDPIYRWVYRPEMQFSVFDFSKQKLELTNDNGDKNIIDLTSDGNDDIMSLLLGSDLDYVELLYDLLSPNETALDPFGPEQELVISIGAEEDNVLASFGSSSGFVTFDHPEHIEKLTSNDYLTISFFMNNDAGNVLWEYQLGGGIELITSADPSSRAANSFIICEQAAQDKTACKEQQPINAKLLIEYSDTDTVVWMVEALEGNDKGEDLIGSVYSSDKAKDKSEAYGKVNKESIKLGTQLNNTNASKHVGVGVGDNLGKYNEPWKSQPTKIKDALYLSFYPDMSDVPHMPDVYEVRKGSTYDENGTKTTDVWRHNPHVGYKISAIINGSYTLEAEVKMDEKDIIRQEYINHLTSTNKRDLFIDNLGGLPSRELLVDKDSIESVLSGDWSQADDYQYMLTKHLELLAEIVKSNVFIEIEQDVSILNDITVSLPSGETISNVIRVNSGWRNPERNERVGGVATSRHMVARALDVGVEGIPGYGSTSSNRSKLLWVMWNALTDAPAIKDNVYIRYLLENLGTGLIQSGSQAGSENKPTVVPMVDVRNAQGDKVADGIPDVFNEATHFHVETKPSLSIGD